MLAWLAAMAVALALATTPLWWRIATTSTFRGASVSSEAVAAESEPTRTAAFVEAVVESLRGMGKEDTCQASDERLTALSRSASEAELHALHEAAARVTAATTSTLAGVERPAMRQWYAQSASASLIDLGLYETATELVADAVDEEDRHPSARASVYELELRRLLTELRLQAGQGAAALQVAERGLERLAPLLAEEPAANDLLAARAALTGSMARVWLNLGDLPTAWRWLKEQRDAAERSEDALSLYMSAMYRAEFWGDQHRTDRALAALDEAQRMAPDSLAPAVARVQAGVIEAQLAKEDITPWRKELQRLAESDALDSGGRVELRAMLATLALQQRDLTAAEAHIAALHELLGAAIHQPALQAQVAALEGWYDRSRGADDTTLRRRRAALEAATTALLESFDAYPPLQSGHGFLAYDSRRRVIGELIELDRVLDPPVVAAEEAATQLLSTEAMASPVRTQNRRPATVDDIRERMLLSDDAVLLFLLGPETSHAVVIDHDDVKLFAVAGRNDLHRSLQRFGALLTEPSETAAWEKEAGDLTRRLADVLLPQPLREALLGHRVVTIADHGTMPDLAWECLMLGDGSLLGERLAIVNLTALPLAVAAGPPPMRARARSAEIFATLRGAGEGPWLTVDPQWFAPIAAVYEDCSLPVDEQASLRVLGAHSFDADVTEILAHGSPVSGEGVELGDGTLDFDAVAAMPRVSGTFVLSSCRAGRSAQRRFGDEPAIGTLGGALLAAGARAVVQARGDLTLEPHLRLLEALHGELAAGVPVAVATQAARQHCADDPLRYRFEHAQMRVFGLGQWPAGRR